MVNLSEITDVNLKNAIQNIVTSISTDPQWQDYEVLNAALQQGKKDVANYLLDRNCTVNRPINNSANSPLHHAVKLADIFLVAKLLEKGASVTTVNAESNSSLHLAFLLDHTEIVDLILTNIEQTVNYDDVSNKQGLTHLHIACARGNAQVANDFEYSGADILAVVSKDSPVYANYNCMRFAYESKSTDTLEVVLRATEPLGSCVGDSPRTHLIAMKLPNYGHSLIEMHHDSFSFCEDKKVQLSEFQRACFKGFADKVKTFLDKGKNVNEVMTQDASACPLYTPLHFAVLAKKNGKEVIELLLERGADVDLKDGFGMTPLHLALYNSSKCLRGKDYGNNDALKILYAAVKDKEINPMDMFGLTYFHAAVAVNDVEMVKKLIEKGEGDCKPILPNCRNFAKYTPLHFAVQFGHEDLAKLLVDRGTDVNANEDESQFDTPLQTAINYGQCKLVDFLLSKGADAKVVTYYTKLTTLHLLVERYNNHENEKAELVRLVKTLVKHGADINGRDEKLYTPLHNACLKLDEEAEMVRELLTWGADVNLKTWRLETPFEFAYDSVKENTSHHFSIFYDQIQKLKVLGLKVDSKNEKFCEMVKGKKEECNLVLESERTSWLEEIEKMKKDMLDEKISLYDYVKKDTEQAAAYARNERIVNLTLDEKCSLYPNYGYLIIVTHWRSQNWLAAQQLKNDNNVEKIVTVKKPLLRPKKPSNATPVEVPANATLLDVARLGDIERVKEMLAKGAFGKLVDSQKNSPLHLAFISNHEEIVDLLLTYMKDKSSFVNLTNNLGLSHLHIAAARGNEFIVQKLLKAKANPEDVVNKNSPNYPGYTALQFACDSKSLATIQLLASALKLMTHPSPSAIAKGQTDILDATVMKFLVRMQSHLENTTISAFHQACLSGSVRDVKRFLDKGQDVNAVADRKSKINPLYTALHFAVESEDDRQKKIELLLQRGVDVEKRDGYCMTPLHLLFYIEKKKKNPIAECFYEREEDEALDILYKAVKDKESNLMDACGLSYLHIAAAAGDCMQVKRMLFRGADVNQAVLLNSRGFSKYTPLHFAAESGQKSMVKLLIKRGANVNANEDDSRFDTPLQTAIAVGLSKVAQVLLENGADAKVVKKDGKKTIIHLLTEEIVNSRPSNFLEFLGMEDCWLIEKMVKCGADIDAKDSGGYTALHTACFQMYGHWDVVEHLLMMGADINIKTKDGATALDIAFRGRFRENYIDFAKLYHHVQKLKDLGLQIDPRNERFCEILMKKKNSWMDEDENERETIEDLFSKEKMDKKKKERQKEINQLKEDMLTDDVSLYDYLRMTPQQAAVYAKTERIQFIIEDDEPRVLYDIYGYLIPVMYRKSLECNERPKKVAKRRMDRKSTE